MLLTSYHFRIGGSIHGYLLGETSRFVSIEVITDFHSEGLYLYPKEIFARREQTKLDIFHHHLLTLRGVAPRSDALELTESDDWESVFDRLERRGEIIGIEGKPDTDIYELGIITEIDRSGVSLRVFDEFGVWRTDEVYILFEDIFVVMIDSEYLRVLGGFAREHISIER